VTSGTFAGTQLLSSVLPIAENNAWGIGFKGHMYFPVNDPAYGEELWRSNGTGASMFENIVPDDLSWHNNNGVQPGNPIICGNYLYFWGLYNRGSHTDFGGLYRTDGIGTNLVAEMNSHTADPEGTLHFDQVCYKNNLYFAGGVDGDCLGCNELYKYNSTTGSVTMVKDIMDDGNPDPTQNGGSNVDNLTPCNGLLFFTAKDVDHGKELWVTDGTTANTRMLVDLNGTVYDSYYSNFYCYDDTLLFSASPSYTSYQQIYTSDGTIAGTVATGIQPRLGPGNWGPQWMTHNGVLFFRGIDNWNSGSKEYAVYTYKNGVAKKVEDVFPSQMESCGDDILISHSTAEYGTELYSLDVQNVSVGFDILPSILLLLE
jgi:ELWxxDGT repeat protein